jgi:hypothetical protein
VKPHQWVRAIARGFAPALVAFDDSTPRAEGAAELGIAGGDSPNESLRRDTRQGLGNSQQRIHGVSFSG